MIASPAIQAFPPAAEKTDYPFAFWCLVFFTFIVFVAPQNRYESLEPLHLARISAILAVAAYILRVMTRLEPFLPRGQEYALIAWFIAFAALSIPFSLWPGGSIETITALLAKSVIVCLLMAQLVKTLPQFKRMLWFTLLYCIIVAFVAISQYGEGHLVEGYRTPGAYAGINSNPNDLALTLNLILPFGLACYGLHRGFWQKGLCVLFVVMSVMAIVLSYSRGGFITLTVVLVLYSWKMKKMGRGKWFTFLVPIILAVMAFSMLAPSDYDDRLEAITDFSKDKTGSGQVRWDNAMRALQVIAAHPLVGVGIGMNILALNEQGAWWSSVHNVYLQIASEIGIPGLIVFLLLIVRLLQSARRIQAQFRDRRGSHAGERQAHELVALATAAEVSLLAFCTAALFHPSAYHFYFYYIAGFALALKGIAGRLQEAADDGDADMFHPRRRPRAVARRTLGHG